MVSEPIGPEYLYYNARKWLIVWHDSMWSDVIVIIPTLYHLKHPVHRIYLQYRSSTNTRTWPACFFVISSIGLLFQSGRCI